MPNPKIDIIISSDSDFEELTVEIFYDGKFVALLNQDEGLDKIKIEFPSIDVKEDKVLRKMDLSTFEKALSEAKRKIMEK